MMVWLLAGAMLLAAVGFTCFRVLFPEKSSGGLEQNSEQMNRTLYREHLADLERQYLGNNDPTEDQNQQQALVVEAQRQLLIDDQDQQSKALNNGGAALLAAMSLTLCLLAVTLYAKLGAMPDLEIRKLMDSSGTDNDKTLHQALQTRLEDRPDNLYYWLLLARLELGESHPEQAVRAYRQARRLSPDDPALNAELAQALFIQNNNQVNDEAERLIAEVLGKQPNNTMALELAGIAAFAKGDYPNAARYWQRSLKGLPTDSVQAQALQAGMLRARSLIKDKQITSDGTDGSILLNVSVALGDNIKEQALTDPEDTVFVYVREWQGMPMPLVAQRYTVADLPLKVEFSDAMSLSPSRQLSSIKQLGIIVRIAASGSRQAASGDFEGRLGPVSLDDGSDYAITIDTRLP